MRNMKDAKVILTFLHLRLTLKTFNFQKTSDILLSTLQLQITISFEFNYDKTIL